MFARTTAPHIHADNVAAGFQSARRVPQHIRGRGGSFEPVNDDHSQPFAPDLSGLPMAVAQHETRSVSGRGRFDLDELALRLGQRIIARQKVADDGLQMAVAQKAPRLKWTHPRRAFGGVEPVVPLGAHGIGDLSLTNYLPEDKPRRRNVLGVASSGLAAEIGGCRSETCRVCSGAALRSIESASAFDGLQRYSWIVGNSEETQGQKLSLLLPSRIVPANQGVGA